MPEVIKRQPERGTVCEHCGVQIRMPDGRITPKAAYKLRIDHGSQPQLMSWSGKEDYQSRETDCVYRLCEGCAAALSEVIDKWVSNS